MLCPGIKYAIRAIPSQVKLFSKIFTVNLETQMAENSYTPSVILHLL